MMPQRQSQMPLKMLLEVTMPLMLLQRLLKMLKKEATETPPTLLQRLSKQLQEEMTLLMQLQKL